MDINFQIALLLVGVVVVAVIVWDFNRKKKLSDQKSDDFNQESLDEMMSNRDHGGFDLTGVGLSRIIDRDDFPSFDDPLTASRDDDVVLNGESFSATDSDELQTEHEPVQEPQPEPEANADFVEPDLIITLSILAKAEEGFVGEKLLHCMLSRGLRFGNMDIFHRFKNTSGEGAVQFSLANAVKPGTFNLDDMSSFQTRGITLFMIMPGPEQPSKSFKLMLDTAQHIADELGGQLVDGSRSALTQQTIQHFSEKIQDFERRNLRSDP